MIHDLFINAVIMIAFITLGNQMVYKDYQIVSTSPLRLQLLLGLSNGAVGCILMIYSVDVISNVIVDFRSYAIILSSVLGGPIPSILASIIIGTFRIVYFGLSKSTVAALIITLLIGIGCSLISIYCRSFRRKWLLSTSLSTALFMMLYIYLVSDRQILMKVLTIYLAGNLLVALILYHYLKYIITSNELYRKYKKEATVDFLTGLNNVRQFDITFNLITEKVVEKGEHLSLIFIDIDFFKKVNDTYGHTEGDIVLRELGQVLLKTCRDFDIVSRNGGEEFSVMLRDCPAEQAVRIAERIRAAVEEHPFPLSTGGVIHITISIGIATYPDSTDNIGNLKDDADSALYQAKRTGRNKAIFQEMNH